MITRRLWLALRYPDTFHPIYKQIVTIRSQATPWWVWFAAIIFAPILLIPALPFTATAYGIFWTLSITQTIAHLKSTQRYEMLSAAPGGELTMNWAVCAGTMHRNGTFLRLHSGGLWAARFLVGFIVLSTVFDSLTTFNENDDPLYGMAIYVTVAIGLVIDHYQSVVLCALCSMLLPTLLSDTFSVRLITPSAFLGVQILTYLLTAIMSVVLLTVGLRLLNIEVSLLGRLPIQLALFVLIREAIVFILWRGVLHQLKSNWTEAQPLLDWHSHRLI